MALSERLKDLREQSKLTQQEVADAVMISTKTYYSYESGHPEKKGSGKTYVFPQADTLERLADLYEVSIDNLMGRSDHAHIENEDIEKITGLSEKSIEVLREIQESKSAMPDGGRGFGVLTDDYSLRTIDLINYVLEEQYEWVIERKKIRSEIKAAAAKGKKELRQLKIKPLQPLYTVFTGMYNAIFGDDAICTADKKNINTIMGSVSDQLDSIYYYDKFSRATVSAGSKELWQTYNTNKVITWINNHRSGDKRKTLPDDEYETFESIEEYEKWYQATKK